MKLYVITNLKNLLHARKYVKTHKICKKYALLNRIIALLLLRNL